MVHVSMGHGTSEYGIPSCGAYIGAASCQTATRPGGELLNPWGPGLTGALPGLRRPRSTHHAACSMLQHAVSCSTQHAACSMQHAARSTQLQQQWQAASGGQQAAIGTATLTLQNCGAARFPDLHTVAVTLRRWRTAVLHAPCCIILLHC